MLLTGDINLANVTDPTKPFALVADRLHAEDVVFGNLEGCLSDVIDPYHYMSKAGWRNAGTAGAPALRLGGFDAVGCANNVTFGREAILESLAVLDELGVPHTGAGHDLTSARRPVMLERGGTRYGFLQYTSVFWPIGHQASDARRGGGSDPLEKQYDAGAGLPDAPSAPRGRPSAWPPSRRTRPTCPTRARARCRAVRLRRSPGPTRSTSRHSRKT